MNRRVPTAATVIALAALVLVGCSAGPEPEPTTIPDANVTPTTAPTEAEPTPTPTPTALPTPTCETLIPQNLVDQFTESGWEYEEEAFRVGDIEVPGGVMCTWGDFDVPSDHVQLFGWAPIDGTQSADLQHTLVTHGWVRVDDEDGVYLTEDPDVVSAPDDDGFGLTYEFGDGWVMFADTKQSLVLIDWPPA